MYVERLLQIHIAALCCLASLLLGMGERSTVIPVGMLLAAMVSVWITDFKGWFALSKRVADWAALGALVACLPAAMRLERNSLISSVGEFILLLQVIHLFRRKDGAVYRHLMQFSVLQVVVAALLTQDLLFGVLHVPVPVYGVGGDVAVVPAQRAGQAIAAGWRRSRRPSRRPRVGRWLDSGRRFPGFRPARPPWIESSFGGFSRSAWPRWRSAPWCFSPSRALAKGHGAVSEGMARTTVGFLGPGCGWENWENSSKIPKRCCA